MKKANRTCKQVFDGKKATNACKRAVHKSRELMRAVVLRERVIAARLISYDGSPPPAGPGQNNALIGLLLVWVLGMVAGPLALRARRR